LGQPINVLPLVPAHLALDQDHLIPYPSIEALDEDRRLLQDKNHYVDHFQKILGRPHSDQPLPEGHAFFPLRDRTKKHYAGMLVLWTQMIAPSEAVICLENYVLVPPYGFFDTPPRPILKRVIEDGLQRLASWIKLRYKKKLHLWILPERLEDKRRNPSDWAALDLHWRQGAGRWLHKDFQ
jgi:hypothetical protein